MKVELTNGQPAALADIRNLEREIGQALPGSFLEFIRQHDGAELETNIFKIGEVNETGVNRFIPVRKILDERVYIENISFTAFPIAWAEGGNCIIIDAASEAVYFWDHEQPTPLVKIASDFTAFMDALQPFDPSTIRLSPGQLKSAWIDPDFLSSLHQ